MPYTLEQFYEDCRNSLKADPGAGGREQVRLHLEKLLADPRFVEEHLGPAAEPGRRTIYRDAETGFCVLTYVNKAPRVSPPHDHGDSWAVYGQAIEHTHMTEYRRVDGGAGPGHADLEVTRQYRLEPGHAGLYDVGDIHSIDHPATARYVRVTGKDLENAPRLKFDREKSTATVMRGTGVPGNPASAG